MNRRKAAAPIAARLAARACTGVAFALVAIGGITAPTTMAAPPRAASINNVSFRAPVHTSYDHSTGGGAWNTGAVTYVKGELESTNFKCGDIVSYMLELNVPASPGQTPPLTAQVVLTYTTDTTGQSGVALDPLTGTDHLLVNSGAVSNGVGAGSTDTGMSPNPGTATVLAIPAPSVAQSPGKPMFSSHSTAALTFSVGGLRANDNVIVRSDAVIRCLAGSRPTGNLQASLTSVNITSPAAESINAGNQTINLKVVGNLGGIGSPLLSLTKTATTAGGSCPGAKTLTVEAVPASVRYCYELVNHGTVAATGVVIHDDNSTPGTPGDDLTVNVGTVPAGGQVVVAHADTSLASLGTFTNTAHATSTNGATSNDDTATVTVQRGLNVVKQQAGANPTAIGGVITYSITATNSKVADTYTSVVPSDANGVIGGCTPVSGSSLAPGESMTCSVTHVVTSADAAAGEVDNQATFSANLGGAISRSTNTVVTPVEIPKTLGITIDTPSRGKGPLKKGQKVTYTIVVTNTSDGASVPDVNVVDPNATIESCSPAAGSTLAAGETMTCVASHVVTSNDASNGEIDNSASVTGGTAASAISEASESVVLDVATDPGTLPATGRDSGQLLLLGLMMFIAGIGFSALGRHPRRHA
jgi:hypothetical protein